MVPCKTTAVCLILSSAPLHFGGTDNPVFVSTESDKTGGSSSPPC